MLEIQKTKPVFDLEVLYQSGVCECEKIYHATGIIWQRLIDEKSPKATDSYGRPTTSPEKKAYEAKRQAIERGIIHCTCTQAQTA